MSYTISKTFRFDAAHSLPDLPEDHPCRRLHGHTYHVECRFRAENLDDYGMVVEYGDLGWIKGWLDSNLDHRHLNEVLDCPTTCEHLSRFLFYAFREGYPSLVALRVSEGHDTWVEYSE